MGEVVAVDAPGLEPPPPRPEPKHDQWGRYVIPDPVTGAERHWTRATTWAETVAERYALERWGLRMAVIGLAERDDLRLAVSAVLEPDSQEGKKKLDQLVKRAQEQARASARATIGTALHSFCEAVDSGRSVRVPAPFDRDIEEYRKATAAIRISRNYIEQIGVIRSLGVAGKMDRLVRFPHGSEGRPVPMIGDVKTGTNLHFSWHEIAIQLALYAHADTIFDPATGRHRKMLQVDQDRALVIHLPAGEARCQLYIIDIAAGWEMAQICGGVREWHKRKDLAQPLLREKKSDA